MMKEEVIEKKTQHEASSKFAHKKSVKFMPSFHARVLKKHGKEKYELSRKDEEGEQVMHVILPDIEWKRKEVT